MVIDPKRYYLLDVDAKSHIHGILGSYDTEEEAAAKVFGKFKVYTGESVIKIRGRDPLWKALADHRPDLYGQVKP